MLRDTLKGTGVALVTPFKKDQSIDFAALENLIEIQIKGGIDYIVTLGTTGESVTLTEKEKIEVFNFTIDKVNGRLPIVIGIGGNNTASVIEAFGKFDLSKVVAILSVAPYYNKPTQEGLFQHYTSLANVAPKPIILYNVPGRTGSNMLAETTLELAKIENIVAMKEASGNMEQIMELIRLRPEGFGILSGDDAITMPLIAAGADGVISVVANALPEKFAKMVKASVEENLLVARKEHYDLLPITKMFFEEGNPGGVKIALAKRSVMNSHMRLPLVQVSEGLKNRIEKEIESLLK